MSNTTASTPSTISSTSYPSAIHKKVQGRLILNETGITFYPIYAPAATTATATAGNGSANAGDTTSRPSNVTVPWLTVQKHQVSPASHAKNLIKFIRHASAGSTSNGDANNNNNNTNNNNKNGSSSTKNSTKSNSLTFELTSSREDLERLRKDVSNRLISSRRIHAQNTNTSNDTQRNRKRSFQQLNNNNHNGEHNSSSTSNDQSTNAISSSVADNSTGMCSKSPCAQQLSSSFTKLTDTVLGVAHSSLLASHPPLREQHSLLVTPLSNNSKNNNNGGGHDDSNNNNNNSSSAYLDESDFWSTHSTIVAHQAARIHGILAQGQPSTIKSSLDLFLSSAGSKSGGGGGGQKSIKLGVEEIRQIFIQYPAVHQAYEQKVPLELSEEQFWRKYLESEFFYRDRGRLGTHFRMMDKATAGGGGGGGEDQIQSSLEKKEGDENGDKKDDTAKEQEENARVATASSNDIFSRMEIELQNNSSTSADDTHPAKIRKVSSTNQSCQNMAIGQFDLAATANTERGSKLLLHSTDRHPTSASGSKGSKVIDKYNRHWAAVLNPEEATAGSNLKELTRISVNHVLAGDDDPKAAGGLSKEMDRLVGYANAKDGMVDHVRGAGDDGEGNIQQLHLQNVSAYLGKEAEEDKNGDGKMSIQQRNAVLSKFTMKEMTDFVSPLVERLTNIRAGGKAVAPINDPSLRVSDDVFPEAKLGQKLLVKLSERMVQDSMTESDAIQKTNQLPESFRHKLTSYFRRSGELLRHFFALRQMIDTEKSQNGGKASKTSKQKLQKIVNGLEVVYREMEGVRKSMPQTEVGETMRKMYLPVMDQLDWAIKLHREGTGGGGGGGFVTVED